MSPPRLHPSPVRRAKASAGIAIAGLLLGSACDPAEPLDLPAAPLVEEEKPPLDFDARTLNAVPHQLMLRGSSQELADAIAQLGGRVIREHGKTGWQLVELPSDISVMEGINRLQSESGVLAEPNFYYAPALTEPPSFGSQWGLHNDGSLNFQGFPSSTPDIDVNAPEAWGTSETPGAGAVLGMIDVGLDLDHPAFAGRLWTNPGEIAGDGLDNDGNGYIDDIHGWATGNVIDNGLSHGTSVGAMMTGYGETTGIAPGADLVTCVPYSAWDQRFLTSSTLVDCLEYLLTLKQAGVNIVATNNSYTSRSPSEAVRDAIAAHRDAGILFVAAAGNDGYDNDERPLFPASFDLANVVSVGAVDYRGEAPPFSASKTSNYGLHTVHLAAPGWGVYTAANDGTYEFGSGTSLAAPMVAGGAALLFEDDPSRSMSQIKNLLMSSGIVVPGASDTVSERMLRLSDPGSGGALDCTSAPIERRLEPKTKNVHYTQAGQEVTLRYLSVDCDGPATSSVYVSGPSSTILLFDGGTGKDELAGDGIFSGSYTPPTGGDHEITFPDGDVVTVHAGPVIREGVAVPYAPETLVAPTELTELTGQLDAVTTVSLPFDVEFNASTYSAVSVSSHGTAVLGSSTFMDFYNTDLSGTTLPDALFAPYWDDLDLRAPSGQLPGKVRVETLGTAPTRRFVIEWHNARHYSRGGDPITVQMVFYEDQSQYLFHYVDTDHATSAWDYGASATVGIRGHDSYQLVYSYNAPSVPSGTSIQFDVVAPWQNPADAYDTTADGLVTALDALVIINQLNRQSDDSLPDLSVQQPPFYYDVSGDNRLTALDALRVINELSRRQDAGEPLSVVDTNRPWQENEDGILYTGMNWQYAMGYHFTPEVDGAIDSLGAFVNGTKVVKLFETASGSLLASATVTGANDWAWESIGMTEVTAGTTYTVAVYLDGSGGSYRYLESDQYFPRSHGGVTIEAATYAYTGSDPDARPTNSIVQRAYGQADVGFVPDVETTLVE